MKIFNFWTNMLAIKCPLGNYLDKKGIHKFFPTAWGFTLKTSKSTLVGWVDLYFPYKNNRSFETLFLRKNRSLVFTTVRKNVRENYEIFYFSNFCNLRIRATKSRFQLKLIKPDYKLHLICCMLRSELDFLSDFVLF